MVFRIYNVVDETGRVVKIGSTIRTLKERGRLAPYNTDKYKNCKLELRREFVHGNREFGEILLRVREQFEISRAHLWLDENGWNSDAPIRAFLCGRGDLNTNKIGGIVGGNINKKSGWASKLGKKQGPISGQLARDNGRLKEISLRGASTMKESGKAAMMGKIQGPILGAANVASGHIQNLGYIYGHTTGKANLLKYVRSDKNKERLKKIRTPEHQSKAASASGKKKYENKTGIHAVDADHSAGTANLQKYNHTRWHIGRNILNPKCSLCSPQEKSA